MLDGDHDLTVLNIVELLITHKFKLALVLILNVQLLKDSSMREFMT